MYNVNYTIEHESTFLARAIHIKLENKKVEYIYYDYLLTTYYKILEEKSISILIYTINEYLSDIIT